MISRNFQCSATRGDAVLTAEISPCSFMYPGYGLQLTVKIEGGGGNTIVQKKEIAIESATEDDCQDLLDTIQIVPCKRCGKPAFDPATCRTNRDGECEKCFMDALNAEFEKAQKKSEEKLKRDDAKNKKQGYTHRIMAWVHPPQGEDYQLVMYMQNATEQEIVKVLKRKKSTVTNDYQIIVL